VTSSSLSAIGSSHAPRFVFCPDRRAINPSSASVTPAMIKDERLATELGIGNPDTFAPPAHVFKNIPNRADYQRVWAEVKAS